MNVKRLVALPLLLISFAMLHFWFAPEQRVQAATTNQSQPAAQRSLQLTVVLTPTQDVSIDSLNPTINYEGSPELLVATLTPTALAVQNSLLRFDLQAIIPAGSLINKAQLRLALTNGTGATGWSISAGRIISDWVPSKVTWNSRPAAVDFYSGLPVPNSGNQPVTWDVTNLVAAWVNQSAPNFGLVLAPGNSQIARRVFSSSEGKAPPQLLIDYTPPPTAVTLSEETSVVTLDGSCDLKNEYASVTPLIYVDRLGAPGIIYLAHDTDNLYICINAPLGRANERSFGVYLDTNHGREQIAQPDDYALQVQVTSNLLTSLAGTGNINTPYKATNLLGWEATTIVTANSESAEFRIPRKLFARTCTSPFGLAIYHQSVLQLGDIYGLSAAHNVNRPGLWLEATLQNPNCIRVCSEQAIPCGAAGGALVRNAKTGTIYSVDTEGYVQNREQIADGDPLWATMPINEAHQATLYATSGDPQVVSSAAFQSPVSGTMTLVVSPQRPLWVQDLTVSAQWYVEGDAVRAARLRADFGHAAEFFYAFTDGQFTLGRINVQQSYDGWDKANLKLHINNTFQPRAVIGGIVPIDTPDISPTVSISYTPGSIYMGSYWNRFGTPPGQTVTVNNAVVPTSTLQLDWSMALAHELGHYLLYLYDTYTGVDGKASQELAKTCTGSAMGDVYEPSNQAYIFDKTQWQGKCNTTEAYAKLGGRTEWQTIHLWYPWTITPTRFVSGPVLPVGVTQVNYLPPSTLPGPPATSQIFDLLYRDNETVSGEARIFLIRGDQRVLEQGKPAKGINKAELIDAQLGDRLCVYDLNDHAKPSESPRHQFGCEIIQPNDAEIQMTKDVTWQPIVQLAQVGPNQLAISVTQSITQPVGAQLVARLYPEHGTVLMTTTLTATGNLYHGQFNLPTAVPPAYVQLWVNETPGIPTTRREVMVDRGTGGSGAFGPAKRLGSVFVVSSDGDATYEQSEPTTLLAGESIAWQNMPSTLPLPPGTEISGQSYRLDAFPASLVRSGTVNIQYDELADGVKQASVSQMPPRERRIYFWNGQHWQPLETTFTTPVNAQDGIKLATAPSQGTGVYAVLISDTALQQKIFLSLIQR